MVELHLAEPASPGEMTSELNCEIQKLQAKVWDIITVIVPVFGTIRTIARFAHIRTIRLRMRTDEETDSGKSLANSATSVHKRHAVTVTDYLVENSKSWKF